ncbi:MULTISPECIES: hypothetical protein [Kitasatospora]|uniref:Uncharacterized protein n=1 Tax=Kitasatospora setae (strain ATCC 33774 / DSM 43861 / JCM 3304 / KCC A-0304 / NBRC 14216 / KM-6054) TaxID=452652 RepID=E4NJY7_KITSK|nr:MULTISPECIES: hypothetical protein [Kitasatospora]BAJ33285.1 hypothetical protein KSE_75330 [Kitasatospora setae KM-6054]
MTTQTDPAPDLHPGTSTDLGALRRQLAVLDGAKVVSVHVPSGGEGLFALLLGLAHRHPDGRAELLHRWLTVCGPAWRLDRIGPAPAPGPGSPDGPDGLAVPAAASGDAVPRPAADLRVLIGREITGVRLTEPGWDALVEFGDHRLSVFPTAHRTPETTPDWVLRLPSRRRLVVGPGARWAERR